MPQKAKKAKTAKVAEPAVELSEFEKFAIDCHPADVPKTFNINGMEFVVPMKQHVPVEVRSNILNSTEALYFPGGVYDQESGDSAMIFLIFAQYTGLNFDYDLDAFERMIAACHNEAPWSIIDAFPAEATGLLRNVYRKVDEILQNRTVPVEQLQFYNKCSELVDAAHSLMNGLDRMLSSAQAQSEDEPQVKLEDILEAAKMIGKKDEKKITQAVLDFQEAKAKKANTEGDSPAERAAVKITHK